MSVGTVALTSGRVLYMDIMIKKNPPSRGIDTEIVIQT